ncbi:MAG: large conductance mechanosensitive channel protein MscL [Pseudomonadota bacterium]
MLREFKEFAMRGNVMDMAIGIILGAAFGKIVSSFVKDIMMPPLGKVIGGVDFSQLFINLDDTPYATLEAAQAAGAATINYGAFVNTVIDFLIVAFVIFTVVKGMNAARRREEAPPAEPTTKNCPRCISEIPIDATRCAFCTSDV